MYLTFQYVLGWVGLISFIAATFANFYWAAKVAPIVKEQEFRGITAHHQALVWVRDNLSRLSPIEKDAARKALAGYRYNLCAVWVVVVCCVIATTADLLA